MNLKKEYIPVCGSVLLTVTCCSAVSSAFGKDDAKRPNILLIHCDQLRFDALGCNGNGIVHTPNIDKLAAMGVNFANAYTPIGTSCPARQCLLSGKWPEQHRGLWNYDNALPVTAFDEPVWTEKVQEAGYAMGYVGKWHVHSKKTPLDFGFDDYVSYQDYNKWRKQNGITSIQTETGKTKWMGGYTDLPKEQAAIHWLAGKALDLILKYEKEGKPWHVRLDHSEPHLPCFPSKEYYDKYADVKIPEWPNFKETFEGKPYIQRQQIRNWAMESYDWEDWQGYLRSYYATIEQLDDAVGILIDELDRAGITDHTVIIFTTDHGDAAGGHRMIDKHYVMYEEEIHVPLIVRWDGVVEAGSTCRNFIIQELDLAATIPDLAGISFESAGRSFLPFLTGEEPESWRQYAFSNYNGQQFGLFVMRMIRDHRYKYVWNPTDTDEFYDMENDPWELKNQIRNPKYAEEIKRLRRELYEDLQRRKDPIAGKPSAAAYQLLDGHKN